MIDPKRLTDALDCFESEDRDRCPRDRNLDSAFAGWLAEARPHWDEEFIGEIYGERMAFEAGFRLGVREALRAQG
jgi:hypothetical protein